MSAKEQRAKPLDPALDRIRVTARIGAYPGSWRTGPLTGAQRAMVGNPNPQDDIELLLRIIDELTE